ncbi:hypothetical protein J2X01_003435 [Arthrobacter ginsengisoli]|uniref:Uncharacterized protein n=1 Tax=Arthrobacter ginsengisoli TaxID=1356565 RepID=A0ABU1UG26_9MICC|nr:hypothetical protein [Arthrobacter ginsengisoli]
MTIQLAPGHLLIAIQTLKELDAALDKAVDLLKPRAMTQRVGILLTRLAPGCYKACLDHNLPSDTTWESWGACNDPR